MKSISASIILLAAAIMIVGGAFVARGDTGLYAMFAGTVAGLAGLVGWFLTLRN